jgi:hypothetical protein
MGRSTMLTLVKRRSTWAITSKTSPTIPNDTPWSTHGQGLVKTLVKTLEPLLTHQCQPVLLSRSPNFTYTSNSPNTKVVYFVEGHNFHVEWHCWFEVQIGEKCRSTPVGTIHWSRVFYHVLLRVLQNLLSKTLVDLCRSCRGALDLQLSYGSFGPLVLKNFEKSAVKQC